MWVRSCLGSHWRPCLSRVNMSMYIIYKIHTYSYQHMYAVAWVYSCFQKGWRINLGCFSRFFCSNTTSSSSSSSSSLLHWNGSFLLFFLPSFPPSLPPSFRPSFLQKSGGKNNWKKTTQWENKWISCRFGLGFDSKLQKCTAFRVSQHEQHQSICSFLSGLLIIVTFFSHPALALFLQTLNVDPALRSLDPLPMWCVLVLVVDKLSYQQLFLPLPSRAFLVSCLLSQIPGSKNCQNSIKARRTVSIIFP